MEIREISETDYTSFANNYVFDSVYQTAEYAAVMKKQDYNYLFLGAYENGSIIAASLLLIRTHKGYSYAYAPRGFLIDYSNKELLISFTKEVKKFLNSKGIVAVKISPIIVKDILDTNGNVIGNNPNYDLIFNNLKAAGYYHFGYNKGFEGYKPRYEAIIDISKDYRLLFKNIKKEYKTKIRSAERQGIKIYRADSNELNLLYEQTKEKYPRDIEYFQDSYKYFNQKDKMDFYYAKLDTQQYLKLIQKEYIKQEELVSILNNEVVSAKESSKKLISRKIDADRQLSILQNRIVVATNTLKDHPDGFVIASALIAKHHNNIYLYMDGYNPAYKNFNAKHLILWKVIEKYSRLGYKRFNLGGIADPTNEKYKGLLQFKTNFGASIVEYIGDLELVTNNFRYAMYKNAIKH